MKVKNVIKWCLPKYGTSLLHIMSDEKVLFSGSVVTFNMVDPDMIEFKHEVENMAVLKKMIYHNELFLFV